MGFCKLSPGIFWQNHSSLAGFHIICYIKAGTDLSRKFLGQDLKSTIYPKIPRSFLGGMIIQSYNLGAGEANCCKADHFLGLFTEQN